MLVSIPPNIEKLRSASSRSDNPRGKTYLRDYNNPINKIENPLKGRRVLKTQPTFKGFSIKSGTVKELQKAIDDYISKDENAGFEFVKKGLKKFLKNEKVRKRLTELGIPENRLDLVTVDKSIGKEFAEAFTAPFEWAWRKCQKRFGSTKTKCRIIAEDHLKPLKRRLTGYYLEVGQHVERFDNAFADNKIKKAINSTDKEAFKKVLKDSRLDEKILMEASGGLENLKKGVNGTSSKEFIEKLKKDYIVSSIKAPEEGKLGSYLSKFSNKSVQVVNRAVSGTATGLFIANDFYNLKMSISGNKKEAKKEWQKRFGQQAARIGIYAYAGYIINSTFARKANKSMPIAIGLAVATAVVSDIMSRVVKGIPILPKRPENISNKPYVIQAAPIQQNPYASPLRAYHAFKGTGKDVSFTGNPYKAFKSAMKAVDNKFVASMPKKMSFKKFEQAYESLSKAKTGDERDLAQKILKIVGKHTLKNENAGIKEVEKAVNGKDITIGGNSAYRIGKALVDTVKFPFDILMWTGRKIANGGIRIARRLKLTKRDFIPNPKPNKFDDAKYVENIVNNHKEIGKLTSGFHSPKVMDYSPSDLSSYLKLTGTASIPFLALDTHNETIETTKNTNITQEKTKQRVVQDTTRQAFSFWAVKSFNDVFKGLINHSLGGNALGVLLNVSGYEAFTRVAVGQPILPKSKEEMKLIEKKRFKKQNWFTKALGGKIKMREDQVIIGSSKLKRPASLPIINEKFAFLGYN